jgi:predicted 3-demethylubiquinone-9 3-methyltransferase (glyoxalase superfamily)
MWGESKYGFRMPKIIPHLWFDTQALDATKLYTKVFPDSELTSVTKLRDTPSGDTDLVSFKLAGQPFMAISAGPYFKFNPSISFVVACGTKKEVDRIHKRLFEGGSALMPLGSYPFSGRYAWIQDRFGLSWQVMLTDIHKMKQKITPTLMFTDKMAGKAEKAIEFYTSIFRKAKVDSLDRYGPGEAPDKKGTIRHGGFRLEGQAFAAMDSARAHGFGFNEAVSFAIACKTQKEIDEYWKRLSAVPKAEQCGWLKDRFGVSWQVVPTILGKLMGSGDAEKTDRVTQAFLKMKKFEIEKLKRAYAGK